jgi:NADH dehydrogenase/putative oxidoreductase
MMMAWRRAIGVTTSLAVLLGPGLDLLIRLWITQAFVISDVHQMMDGPIAASGMLQDITTSYPGMAIEAFCPALLAIGLLTRPAAFAMLLQALLIQPAGDVRLFWAALLLRLVMLGPGALSIDRLLQRGAESLAVPGAAAAAKALARARQMLGPWYQTGLRLWLAAALAGIGIASMVVRLPPWLALLLAVLLAAGAATRLAALALLVLVPLGHLMAGDAQLYWALLLAILALHGAGPYSIDRLIVFYLGGKDSARDHADLPHVVVVGGGFGGIATVRGLRGVACQITLIDQRNHHLFQPLLYQVATAGLSPADIATPIRGMLRGQSNLRVLLGQVTGVDAAEKTVRLDRGPMPYDHLVLATGARHSYFGRDDWAGFAPGLKSVEDGTAIRRRLLLAFEEAEGAASEDLRAAWLTFIIVGGGPTGVELAGAIAELARHGMDQEFRAIDPARARVILVQSGSRLLPAFPEVLSLEAARALENLGVEVQLDRRVEAIDAVSVTVSGKIILARTVLWAAGVMASPAATWLGVAADRAGRLPVGANLTVAGVDSVFAVGDTAASNGWAGQPVPGLAPAAKQGGAYVARVIRARIAGRADPAPFRYRHLGSLATIGRQSAVADFGFVRVRGALAWWLWGAAHIVFLVGGRNRATVLIQWLWAYLTFRRGTRLITNASPENG